MYPAAVTLALARLLAAPPGVDEAQVGLHFEDGFPERGREPVRAAFDRALAQACAPPPCTADCPAGASTLGLEVRGDERVHALRWTASDPRLDAPLSLSSDCELCNLDELEDQLGADLVQLCGRLAALDAAPAVLAITSAPAGAGLRIDGERVGSTPWSGELAPGPHEIELQAPGYVDTQRRVELRASVEERAHIELLPRVPSSTSPAASTPRRPTWPGWASLGTGLVLGVAGATLIAMNGSPWRGRCDGDDIDPDGDCRYVLATRGLGVGLAIAGAAALAGGIGLVVWAQRNSRAQSAGVRVSWSF